jgi:hypothetical protein
VGVDIIAMVQAQRLATLNRSIAATENHERRVANIATKTSALLNGETELHTEHLEEYCARSAYYRLLEEYTRKPYHGMTGQAFTPKGLSLWKRVTSALKASGVDLETFLRAQFTWFHEKFRTAPKPVQLTTDAAVVRAASVKPVQVRTSNIEANIPIGDLFRRCEKQMTDLMRAQKMSREEVYRNLVLPGLAVFPDKFLNADPLWKKVKSNG